MDIRTDMKYAGFAPAELEAWRGAAGQAMDRLWSGKEPMTGWVKAPLYQDEEELEYLLNVADMVKIEAELLVVIGIGGSYMGAKAAIEALPKTEPGIAVRFGGTNFCTACYRELMAEMSRRETVLCVVSKSGGTLEVKAAFDVFKDLMLKKYGDREKVARRIITITDGQKGPLREETEAEGYVSFAIPHDVGGRYSALTPAGLFPMAVAGIDVRELIRGAEAAAASPDWDKDGTDYAIARYLMLERGKAVEALEFYDHRLAFLGEWLKQLYGESEGKEGKGLFPATLLFSRDLHSMGQFLQQGNPVFFETAVLIDAYDDQLEIPTGELKGRTLEELNRAAGAGVIQAHGQAGIPLIQLHVPRLDAYYYGQLLYFFETTCAITAMMMGVNPFDQPGVEDYKAEMRKILDGENPEKG